MSTVNICDVCGKQGPTPFHVTENSDGREWDACSTKCYIEASAK